jgi:hypothetical protein
VSDALNFTGESVALGQHDGIVTLVQGSAFCISGRSGDMTAGSPHGLFFRDSRFLSRLELRINGQRPEPLESSTPDPFSAVFVSRTRPRPGQSDSTLLVFRHRYIGRGMREDVMVRNFADEAAYCSIEVVLEADFAHLFEVKEGRAGGDPDRELDVTEEGGTLVFRVRKGTMRRSARVSFSQPAKLGMGRAVFEVSPATRAASRWAGPRRWSAWPGGAGRCRPWTPTTRACAGPWPAAPRTWAPCASSTPTTPSAPSWRPAPPGS